MPSSFTWLDYSERDRRRALDVIDLFRETGTVDELGIGVIRDAFSDLLFPGTSTIQTRAGYFLLLPWTFLRMERLRVSSAQAEERARWEELRLNEVLQKGEDTDGVFGSSAGKALKRLPSAAYWGGLGTWGIRLFPGHGDAYFRSLEGFFRRLDLHKHAPADPEGRRPPPTNWHPHIPEPPKGFPETATITLRFEDADYLRDRILSHQPGTPLAELVARTEISDLDYKWPWELAHENGLSANVCEQLHHAKLFAVSLHGARLLYNLMLAEKLEREDWIEKYRQQLEEWAADMEELGDEIADWNLSSLWQIVQETRPRPHLPAQAFVRRWVEILRKGGSFRGVWDRDEARDLIRDREYQIKRGRARLHSQRHLELWGGASGADRLEYRWSSAKVILRDIFDGLSRSGDDA